MVVCAYKFSDEALDELIDLSFRIFERIVARPDVVKRVLVIASLLQQLHA